MCIRDRLYCYLVDSLLGNITQSLFQVNDMVSGSNFSVRFILCATIFSVVVELLPGDSLFAKENGERIICEVTVLTATPEVAKRIVAPWHVDAFVENGTELLTTDTPEVKDNSISKTTATHHNAPTRSCHLKLAEYQRMLKILKSTKGCSVTVGPKITTTANVRAIGFAGTVHKYQVSTEHRKARFGTIVGVPEYEFIEDGIVAEHQAKVSPGGLIELNSRIVINTVTNLETFTYDGPAKQIALDLASTETRQVNITGSLNQDEVLIVASTSDGSLVEPRLANWGPIAKDVPYVSQLFRNAGVNSEPIALYYVISAVR